MDDLVIKLKDFYEENKEGVLIGAGYALGVVVTLWANNKINKLTSGPLMYAQVLTNGEDHIEVSSTNESLTRMSAGVILNAVNRKA